MTDTQTLAPHSATFGVVITRADGTVEDLGIIAAGFSNPFKQTWWNIVGQRLANRRIRHANASATALAHAFKE